jgi:ABC-type branched-subunit amino acid transport system substrate-binding protein
VTIRIGLLLAELRGERSAPAGTSSGPTTGSSSWFDIWHNCFQMAVDDATRSGTLLQPVEPVLENVNGLPWGSGEEVVAAWRRLEEAGVLAILGPSNADNCMSIRDTANRHEVPTFVFGCSHQLASYWTFSPSWGSAPVDAILALNWVASRGYRRVAILADTAWHGNEWIEYLNAGARRYGLSIVGTERIELYAQGQDPQLEDARRRVARLQESPADVLVMACSVAANAGAVAVHEAGWDIPRIKAGSAFGGSPEWVGWVGTALFDESNPTFVAWRKAYEANFGASPTGSLLDMALSFTDGVRLLLEGIRLAPIHNRKGLHEGLEKTKLLAAAAGGPTTVAGFGPHDHRAYKGRDTSVLQRYVGPHAGDFEFEGYFDSTL